MKDKFETDKKKLAETLSTAYNLPLKYVEDFANDFIDAKLRWDKAHNNPYDKIIEEAMNEVDFEKIHQSMVALDWKWNINKPKVPSIEELEEKVRELCTRVLVRGSAAAIAGGFEVSKYNGCLRIKFNIIPDVFIPLRDK